MNQQDILVWAAGGSQLLPSFHEIIDSRLLSLLGISEESLAYSLVSHRLPQRFLERYCETQPNWANERLLQWLSDNQQNAMLRLQRQIEAIEEVQDAVSHRSSPLLILKGCSSYALTGQSHFLRFTGDLDVCYDDLDLLWDVLHNLGYSGKRHYTYEYGKLKKGDVTFDLHHHYPIDSYPFHISSPYFNPAQLRCAPRELRQTAWSYEGLVSHSRTGTAKGTENLHVLDVHALILLLCVHSFRNFVSDLHYLDDSRQMRLAEFSDIADLSRHPDFCPTQLGRLIEELNGQHSVAFVETFLQTFQISHQPLIPLPDAGLTFPESLFSGGWVLLDSPSDWLKPRDTKDVLVQLGHQDIFAGAVSPVLLVPKPHLSFHYSAAEGQISLGVEVSESDFQFRFSIPINFQIIEITLHFGGDHFVVAAPFVASDLTFKYKDTIKGTEQIQGVVERAAENTAHWVIKIPLEYLPSRNISNIACFISVTLSSIHEGEDATIYFPCFLQADRPVTIPNFSSS